MRQIRLPTWVQSMSECWTSKSWQVPGFSLAEVLVWSFNQCRPRLGSPSWGPKRVKCTRACDMIICVVLVCCNHTRHTEYIVINRQQPRRWHHSGFVVLGRSFVKTSADREPRRPFDHYAELCQARQMGIHALEAFCFWAINSFNTLSTPSTTTPHSVS